ncbi:MobC family replication-relaxation protein [Vibrio nigripulchritudo]|uniref:MobC family replication-relaxation protein n=1 Tax=Vibrio nigripulchritudo TaxID=28173 RepID=UPI002357C0D2|nr:MobC family replication-relaxation protein [Vibrio nigripulchritudo]
MVSKSDRDKRHFEKIRLVLKFLSQEIYSDMNTLCLMMQYKSRQPMDRLLNKLIDYGFVKKHVFNLPTGKISLWGVTELGLAQPAGIDADDCAHFEPSKVKWVMLMHKLSNQHARIFLERAGWKDWKNGDRYSFKKKFPTEHRPDAIAVNRSGSTVAIETELTLKPVSRYRSIFKSHMIAKQKGYWKLVAYIVKDDEMKEKLARRFDRVEYIQFDESKHPFGSEREKMVRIFTLRELEAMSL